MERHLAEHGYDEEHGSGTHSSSYNKFAFYDENSAYLLFCRYLIGVPFFSETFKGDNNFHNHNAHGLVFEKTFDEDLLDQYADLLGDERVPGGPRYRCHDFEDRDRTVTGSSGDPADWDVGYWDPDIKNALGFNPCSKFISGPGVEIAHDDLDEVSCCDVYMYKEDGFQLRSKVPFRDDFYEYDYVTPPGI